MDWTVIAQGAEIKDGKFNGRLTLDAGGWYSITVRAGKVQNTFTEKTIARVGIGDVFITAGQSNSANCAEAGPQSAKDSRVVYFDGKAFLPACDPIPGGFCDRGSPWSFLGDLLVRTTQVPVCFRSVTLCAVPVREWLPDNSPIGYPLYATLIERSKWFGPYGFRAVLWHQGESDSLAKTSPEDYCLDLGTVIKLMRKEIGYDVDWFVAGASFHPSCKEKKFEKDVLGGQKLLWERKIAFMGPYTDDIKGQKYRNGGVHFNEFGLRAHAERWCVILSSKYHFANPFGRH